MVQPRKNNLVFALGEGFWATEEGWVTEEFFSGFAQYAGRQSSKKYYMFLSQNDLFNHAVIYCGFPQVFVLSMIFCSISLLSSR